MTKTLNWRLSKLPTPDEVRELVKDKIITQEEARDILFSKEEQEDRDKKSLESEIKFLRELVERLSQNNRSAIYETVKYIEKPYIRWNWYKPYGVWCGDNMNVTTNGNNLLAQAQSMSTQAVNFSDIKTF